MEYNDYVEHSALGEAFVSEYFSTSPDELAHHGTKGMRWGRRRYQNEDGSLTALGRLRYGASKAGEKAKAAVKGAVEKHKAKKANEKESKRIEALMKKPVNKLTDAELAERTARAQKQKNLRQLESDSDRLASSAKSFMNRFGGKMLNEALVPATVSAGRNVAEKWLSKKLSEAIGLNEKEETESERLKREAEDAINRKKKAEAEDALERREKKRAEEEKKKKNKKKDN